MIRNFSITLAALSALLLLPMASAAEPGGKGGKALEKRSEKAAERANSQWQEEALRGQERADQVRQQQGSVSESLDQEAKRAEKHAAKQAKQAEKEAAKQAKQAEKEARKASRVDAVEAAGESARKQPKGQARGFWARWFGGGDEAEATE